MVLRFLKIHRRFLYAGAAVVLGVAGAVLLVEGGLRVGWLLVREDPYTGHRLREGPADVVVLCAGDSHTQGIGAPRGMSYPDQLSALLNASDPSRTYQVINLGQSGFNSSQAVNRVLAYLEKGDVQPDLVIFCAGGNNDHNFIEARFLPDEVAGMSLRHRFSHLLAESRAYRLGQMTVDRIRRVLDDVEGKSAAGDPEGPEEDEIRLGLRWQELLEENPAERELIQEWLRKDLDALWGGLRQRNIQLVLMNYFHGQMYVNTVFPEKAREFGVPFVDVRGFGDLQYDCRADRKGLVAPNWHPNEYGYRKIVPMVYQALLENGMIPKPGEETASHE